ncbi:MAG: acyltransferase family protein [Muribaculaceae bacterium]|nr:acyltransferase family protein [Muribaculaceae bacterium]
MNLKSTLHIKFKGSESNSLNIIRWLSAVAIVLCHFLQAYGIIWAWILNVGVQVFFFLSGFLYGKKRITNIKKFYWGRFRKLYIPYFLWVSTVILLLLIFFPSSLSFNGILKQLTMIGALPGLNHLWFMRVIFLCYLILPFFDNCLSKNKMISLCVFAIISVTILVFFFSSSFLWILLYFIGYMCGRYTVLQTYLFFLSFLGALGILVVSEFDISIWKEDGAVNSFLHFFIGIVIFLGLYFFFKMDKFRNKKLNNFLTIFNNGGGYELYLTHHPFLLGPLSMLFISNNNNINILVALILIITSCMMLQWINNKIQRKIDKLMS